MAKINTTHNTVLRILETKPETRGNDYALILEVLKEYIDTRISVETLLLHRVELGVPSLETITRCRRKIQTAFPHLVDTEAKAIRKEDEEEFKQYALNFK